MNNALRPFDPSTALRAGELRVTKCAKQKTPTFPSGFKKLLIQLTQFILSVIFW